MADLDPNNPDLHDIQGYILRGYRMDFCRHLILQISNLAGARTLLAALVEHDPATQAQGVNRQPDTNPQITTAVDWGDTKPDYCLNIGLTYHGLVMLQMPQVDEFPDEFKAGAYAPEQAEIVGDVGESAPERWIGKLDPNNAPNVHIVLTLHALSSEILERTTEQLRGMFKQDDALVELSCFDAEALESYQCEPRSLESSDTSGFLKVHFGYTDGIAQPTIKNAPPTVIPDDQDVVPLGQFVLGYPGEVMHRQYDEPLKHLRQNGSFAAFRVLGQDVDGFEQFLSAHESPTLSRELLAAKMCGRWRNGVPLVLSPDTDAPQPPITLATINNFDYDKQDPDGYSCPFSAHIRRTNPRDETIEGVVSLHRIVRRAMPYGPPYNPAQPHDGIPRGLVGLFINASIADQFAFVMQNWINDSQFDGEHKPSPDKSPVREVLLGNNSPADSYFKIPNKDAPNNPTVITGFGRFVTTCGGAYLFLPSISALRYLSAPPSAANPAASAA
jgi:Dyp-type peroxidase family